MLGDHTYMPPHVLTVICFWLKIGSLTKEQTNNKKSNEEGEETNLFGDLPHAIHKLQENWGALVIRVILVTMAVTLR